MDDIEIVEYTDEYHDAFVALSVAWITEHWELEPNDYDELQNVGRRITEKGGFILMALLGGKPVGTCAMIPMDGVKYDYELAKFTTSANLRGRGIGSLLINSVIRRADAEGRGRLYLETNHLCEAGIHLYEKAGFRHLPGHSEIFDRGDYLMERIPENKQ